MNDEVKENVQCSTPNVQYSNEENIKRKNRRLVKMKKVKEEM